MAAVARYSVAVKVHKDEDDLPYQGSSANIFILTFQTIGHVQSQRPQFPPWKMCHNILMLRDQSLSQDEEEENW